jgi:hypothetical protein
MLQGNKAGFSKDDYSPERVSVSQKKVQRITGRNCTRLLKKDFFAVKYTVSGIILFFVDRKLCDVRQCRVKKEKKMPGWVVLLLFFAAYFILMRWVLPRLGVQT